MNKHPLRLIGRIFAAVACIELAVLIVLLIVLQDPMVLSVSAGVLALQASIFGVLGFLFLGYVKKRETLRDTLIASGYYEMGFVVDTKRVLSVRINGRHPYRVICRVVCDGVEHEYRSDMYRDDPGLRPGDLIPVYLDRQDEKRCYVDVESAILALSQS